MIDFPASPTTGQQFNAAGVTWTWDGTKWTGAGLNTPYLPLSGGTLSGPLTLVSDPTAPLQPATKQYVDAGNVYPRDNRIINGDMRINQRGVSSGTATGYTIDRWVFGTNQVGKGTWGQGSTGPFGFPYYLNFTSSSAYASLAADTFSFNTRIEADAISDFQFGTANAQPITLSFRAYSSVAGTFGGAITNDAGTRTYPFSYTLAASVWTLVTITIPGDTAGTWVMSGNARAMIVYFDLGCGANSRGPAGAWASAGYSGATGAVSIVGTNGANFAVTGVKLEIGSVATPYPRQSLAKSLADCQRYYQAGSMQGFGYGAAAGGQAVVAFHPFAVVMRAVPTMVANWTTQTNCTGLFAPQTAAFYQVGATATAIGNCNAFGTFTASAEL